jgi:hypothetical protein
MFRIILRIACALCAPLLGSSVQAQFTDDFADNDFTTGVVWSGDNSLFTAATGALQSQSPGADNYYLSTPSTVATNAQWEFFVNLKFSTSGANYADIYLMSSAADLTSGVNGYFVRVGGTADRVELFRTGAGVDSSLIATPDGIVNSASDNPFKLRVKRDATHVWTLEYDDGAGGTYTLAGSAPEDTYTTCTHFGVRIEQSSAASPINNHFFDDFVVAPIPVDLTPPTIVSVTATSATNVDVLYSEPLDPAFIGSYDIIPFIGVSGQVLSGDPALVHVTPAIALTSGNTYSLGASAAQDPAGNAMTPASVDFTYLEPATAGPRDVVINEIMADPDPIVGLPEIEFIELFNASTTESFDLTGWTFSDGGTTATFLPAMLAPGQYAIICDPGDVGSFSGFGTVIGLPGFPSALTNTGELLELRNSDGDVVDAVNYTLAWYHDDVKAAGGWTMEQIDPTTPCSGENNWRASVAALGGTPGTQNSVYAIIPDTQEPSLVSVLVNSSTVLQLVFSEAMNIASLSSGTYAITPSIGVAQILVPDPTTVELTLASDLVAGTIYTITVTGVSDCPGNAIGAINTLAFAMPEAVNIGDVVINEVLYDPISGGSDFVELYNKSDKVLSLANWKLANEEDGVIDNSTTITTSAILLLPGEYVLITENAENTAATYPLSHTDRFVEGDMPSYNNGEGTVVLQAPDATTLDLFRYNDDLHFPLIGTTEGVSLERVDPARPSSDNTNWHSAAQTAGFATPGYRNSEYAPSNSLAGELTIDPAIFSPDNDGHQDLLTITYHFDAPGYTGTVKVFDIAGREVVTLVDNALLGTLGQVSWNGIMETGDLARMGPYVVLLEAFEPGGDVQRFRETVVLAHKVD